MPTETENLIDQALAKHAALETVTLDLAELEVKILALGKGKHAGASGRTVTVVGASPSSPGAPTYELYPADLNRARELADSEFQTLFDRTVVYSPCEAFHLLAPKILTPAKARDVIALCQRSGRGYAGKKAYILWK